MEMMKHFCCGPCQSGPFSLVASIPQSGYVPGQSVIVYTNITNHSRVSVDEVRYYLRRTVRYHSQTPSMKTKEEIVNIQQQRTGGVPRNDDARFKVSLLIPAVPPTNTSLCKVVHISYDVKIEAKVPNMHTNPFVIIPITIGTVPLSQNQNGGGIVPIQPPIGTSDRIMTLPLTSQVYLNPSAPQISPTAPNANQYNRSDDVNGIDNAGFDTVDMTRNNNNSTITGQQVSYPDMRKCLDKKRVNLKFNLICNFSAPPSYEESVLFGNRQIEDEDDQHPIGQQLYTPRYPVYHFNDTDDSSAAFEMTRNDNGNRIESDVNTSTISEASTIDANIHSEKLRDKIGNWN